MSFIHDLKTSYVANSNPEFAAQMKTYLMDKFELYGIKTPLRRSLMKPLVQKYRLEIRDTIRTLTFDLYDLQQREMHMVAIELFESQLRRNYKKDDIVLIEKLITRNSWWDSVDFISKQILGTYLMAFPDEIKNVIPKFSSSDNMWLQRSSIIFQLGYKDKTDKELLFHQCMAHSKSEEFFIQKAIGWALREYGKVNPRDVLDFANSSDLKPLSKREAIRRLI